MGVDPKKSVYANSLSPITYDRFSFHHLDIENLPTLDAVFASHKFDAVFNLAARAGVRYSMQNPYVYLSTNTLGTLNILECMRKHGVKKQVLASTSSLYAGCPMPFNEEQPVNTPLSPYAATKKAAEMLSHSYHKLYGLDTTVVRYFTVFGPAGRPDMSIFRFIKWIDEGKPLELLGDGTQSRDFTYVDDIARGTILAGRLFGGQLKPETGNLKPEVSNPNSDSKPQMSGMNSAPSTSGFRSQVSGFSVEAPGFDIINLGGGNNPITLQTVIKFIEEALGKKANIDEQAVAPADIKASWADIAKAERLLGWKPQVTTEEGFRRSIEWYRANKSWLKDIRL